MAALPKSTTTELISSGPQAGITNARIASPTGPGRGNPSLPSLLIINESFDFPRPGDSGLHGDWTAEEKQKLTELLLAQWTVQKNSSFKPTETQLFDIMSKKMAFAGFRRSLKECQDVWYSSLSKQSALKDTFAWMANNVTSSIDNDAQPVSGDLPQPESKDEDQPWTDEEHDMLLYLLKFRRKLEQNDRDVEKLNEEDLFVFASHQMSMYDMRRPSHVCQEYWRTRGQALSGFDVELGVHEEHTLRRRREGSGSSDDEHVSVKRKRISKPRPKSSAPNVRRRKTTRHLSKEQFDALEKEAWVSSKPSKQRREELANEVGLEVAKISKFFSNVRCKNYLFSRTPAYRRKLLELGELKEDDLNTDELDESSDESDEEVSTSDSSGDDADADRTTPTTSPYGTRGSNKERATRKHEITPDERNGAHSYETRNARGREGTSTSRQSTGNDEDEQYFPRKKPRTYTRRSIPSLSRTGPIASQESSATKTTPTPSRGLPIAQSSKTTASQEPEPSTTPPPPPPILERNPITETRALPPIQATNQGSTPKNMMEKHYLDIQANIIQIQSDLMRHRRNIETTTRSCKDERRNLEELVRKDDELGTTIQEMNKSIDAEDEQVALIERQKAENDKEIMELEKQLQDKKLARAGLQQDGAEAQRRKSEGTRAREVKERERSVSTKTIGDSRKRLVDKDKNIDEAKLEIPRLERHLDYFQRSLAVLPKD